MVCHLEVFHQQHHTRDVPPAARLSLPCVVDVVVAQRAMIPEQVCLTPAWSSAGPVVPERLVPSPVR